MLQASSSSSLEHTDILISNNLSVWQAGKIGPNICRARVVRLLWYTQSSTLQETTVLLRFGAPLFHLLQQHDCTPPMPHNQKRRTLACSFEAKASTRFRAAVRFPDPHSCQMQLKNKRNNPIPAPWATQVSHESKTLDRQKQNVADDDLLGGAMELILIPVPDARRRQLFLRRTTVGLKIRSSCGSILSKIQNCRFFQLQPRTINARELLINERINKTGEKQGRRVWKLLRTAPQRATSNTRLTSCTFGPARSSSTGMRSSSSLSWASENQELIGTACCGWKMYDVGELSIMMVSLRSLPTWDKSYQTVSNM